MSLLESRSNNGATRNTMSRSVRLCLFCNWPRTVVFAFASSPGQLFYLPFRGSHFKAIIHPFARSKMRSIPIYLLFNRLFSILRSWQAIYFCLVGSLLLMRNAHFQTEKSKKINKSWSGSYISRCTVKGPSGVFSEPILGHDLRGEGSFVCAEGLTAE